MRSILISCIQSCRTGVRRSYGYVQRGMRWISKGIERAMRPIHRLVHKQPLPVRYTVAGFTVVFGAINLVNPFIPGVVFIYAGVDIFVKTRKGIIHVHQDRVILHTTYTHGPSSLLAIRQKAPLTYKQQTIRQSQLYRVLGTQIKK